ncbi:MAG: hypothetical protein COB04_07685 [Gammaproteobacteria bacterium]|nr:MAG: hypothetical protein COB04_07685 [Gammaproteobacteria bacterium]
MILKLEGVKQKLALGVVIASSLAMSEAALSANAYEYEGAYEFASCGNAQGHVNVNLSASSITTSSSSVILDSHVEGFVAPFDLECDAEGQLDVGAVDVEPFLAKCETFFADEDIDISLYDVVCVSILQTVLTKSLDFWVDNLFEQSVPVSHELDVYRFSGAWFNLERVYWRDALGYDYRMNYSEEKLNGSTFNSNRMYIKNEGVTSLGSKTVLEGLLGFPVSLKNSEGEIILQSVVACGVASTSKSRNDYSEPGALVLAQTEVRDFACNITFKLGDDDRLFSLIASVEPVVSYEVNMFQSE